MNFLVEFLYAIAWRPHSAFAALYWYLTRRKLRARIRLRLISSKAPYAYRMWIKTVETGSDTVSRPECVLAEMTRQPTFTVLVLAEQHCSPESLIATVNSVEAQSYPHWNMILVGASAAKDPLALADYRVNAIHPEAVTDVDGLNLGIEAATGEFIVPVLSGYRLAPGALLQYAAAAQHAPQAAILFADHDEIDALGRRSNPWFKPQWNAEMFFAQDYLSQAFAINGTVAAAVGPIPPEFEHAACFALILQASLRSDAAIVHIPHILSHVPAQPQLSNQQARLSVVAAQLNEQGAKAYAGPFGTVRVQWPLPATLPLVSIIVPTRDQPKLLKACISSLLEKTDFPNFEVLIVDNGSAEAETLAYLERIASHPQVRVLPYHRQYNYSAINNFAAREARGSYICLLNNDTEIVNGDWLSEMVRYAVQPMAGAVGAKLLYGDGKIQHAGVVIGLGQAAGHAHRLLDNDDPGYFRQAHVPHRVSAVTAACLVVAKAKFEAVGGLDETDLAIAFNDVDLCLKLDRAGWQNIYAPQAVLIHHESKSRGKDSSAPNIARYRRELGVLQERWGTKTYADPLHNPNLDRSGETYVIRF